MQHPYTRQTLIKACKREKINQCAKRFTVNFDQSTEFTGNMELQVYLVRLLSAYSREK